MATAAWAAMVESTWTSWSEKGRGSRDPPMSTPKTSSRMTTGAAMNARGAPSTDMASRVAWE